MGTFETELKRITQEYNFLVAKTAKEMEFADGRGDEEAVRQLEERLDGIIAHEYGDQQELRAAYTQFPVKDLLRVLKNELEAKYVADEAIEGLKHRVITYNNDLLGLSIEATTMVKIGSNGAAERNSQGEVLTLDGYVDPRNLENARFYLQAEVTANQPLFDEINKRIQNDSVYRRLVEKAFNEYKNQVFVPLHKKNLEQYLGITPDEPLEE